MKNIKTYSVCVDSVDKNEDWNDDSKIYVNSYEVEAKNPEGAREKTIEIINKELPERETYIWDISENDII